MGILPFVRAQLRCRRAPGRLPRMNNQRVRLRGDIRRAPLAATGLPVSRCGSAALLGASVMLLLTLSVLSNVASAACSRADVDHFLSRGFTPEQVVLLCGAADGDAYPDGDGASMPRNTERADAERALRDVLLRGVDAERVDVDGSGLRWRTTACAEYGPPNLAGQPRERCGRLHVEVEREGLTVDGLRRQILFFGEHGIALRGRILQSWEVDMTDLMPADQARLRDNMQRAPETVLLPLHARTDPESIAQTLQRWIDTPAP